MFDLCDALCVASVTAGVKNCQPCPGTTESQRTQREAQRKPKWISMGSDVCQKNPATNLIHQRSFPRSSVTRLSIAARLTTWLLPLRHLVSAILPLAPGTWGSLVGVGIYLLPSLTSIRSWSHYLSVSRVSDDHRHYTLPESGQPRKQNE